MAKLLTFTMAVKGGGDVEATIAGVNKQLAAMGMQAQAVSDVGFKQAKSASDGLYGSLKDLKSIGTEHQRVFMFFGRQLAETGLVAKETGAAIVGLGAGLASGMWILAAVEAAKLLVGAFRNLGAEARKVDEELAKVNKETQEFSDKILKIDPLTRRWVEASAELNRLTAQAAATYDFMGNVVEGVNAKAIATQRKLVEGLEAELRNRTTLSAMVDREDAKRKGEVDAAERARVILAKEREVAAGQKAIRDRGYDEWQRDYDKQQAVELKAAEDRMELSDLASIELRRANEKRADEERAEIKRLGDEQEREAHRVEAAWRAAGNAMGGAISELGAAIGGQAGKMLSFLGEMIQKAIQLAVALAGTAGPWGWLQVGAAAVAMLAAVASIPSFEVGTPYVPRTGLALVHEGERIVPAAENSMGGGSPIVLNVYAMDARSFADWARRDGSRGIELAVRELTRNGRL